MATHAGPKPSGTPTWLDLMTPDADASRTFYHALFGWEYDIGGPEFGGYTTARIGQRMTAGIVGSQSDSPATATWGLYFASDAIEADVARAKQLGATVLFPPMQVSQFGSMATLIDPTGAQFSFWQAGMHPGWQMTDEPGSTTWYELYSPDAKRARDFYTALLGATPEPMPGEMEYYVLKHGDTMIGGIMQIDPAWGPMQSAWVTYFFVADVDASVAIATSHGAIQMGGIEDSPFGRIAAMRDPAGAVFKLIEPPANR